MRFAKKQKLFQGVNMKNNQLVIRPSKIKRSDHIFALKIRTESNGLGVLKTLLVLLLIVIQAAILVVSYLNLIAFFKWYLTLSLILSLLTCIYVLSSNYHGQAKATWILFLLISLGFGYIIYFFSDKRILLAKSKRKLTKINNETKDLQSQIDLNSINDPEIKTTSAYLFNTNRSACHTNTKLTYYPSGASHFDAILEDLKQAKEFVFIEYFIISNGVLLERFLSILKEKASKGVDVRIIYDDMGSHSSLKSKTKREIIKAGIKLQPFNRLVPIFNIALNLRDHRKIVVVDGKVAYTGGTNLADEYVNEKHMHGYWKDAGIKVDGPAVDNLTLEFLKQWKFLTGTPIDYASYLNRATKHKNNSIVVPFVTSPHDSESIAENMYAKMISSADEKLYIMTPYFIPDETITNLIINKAKSGVDVRLILPDVADKKFVYTVSRNNAEKMIDAGVKLYTMTHSFVHSKVVLNENSAIVGSINIDLRSFNQQFESAVFTNDKGILESVNKDFEDTFEKSLEITAKNRKRNNPNNRLLAGIFNLISPFM